MDNKIFMSNTQKIKENIEKIIKGKSEEIDIILAAMLTGGHVLLDDIPGTGKTMLAKALAKSFDFSFKRVQFTPDLLPSDLTGINFYSPKTGEFSLKPGALFANIVLADEINRATPRTQSALLESMEEKQITIDGETHKLESPYFVIATQNPVENQGTYPLPEAQLDRFLIQISLGYPKKDESVEILKEGINSVFIDNISSVCEKQEFLQMCDYVKSIYIHDDIVSYIVDLAEKTRNHEHIRLGISTRGAMALMNASKAYAAINDREYVTPDDIQLLIPFVFSHRVIFAGGFRTDRQAIMKSIVASVEVPVESWDKIL